MSTNSFFDSFVESLDLYRNMSFETEMNGVFAINKPSGITSAQFLAKVQAILTNSSIFANELAQLRGLKVQQIQKEGGKASRRKLRKVLKVKMGHGGTLDPLATGVLVIGVNKGTKLLQNYLSGSIKTYETEALFGASTTTGDVEGELLSKNGVSHITQDEIDKVPSKFIGHLKQTPPIFAALKMNGKPLYEYAREGLPLPKPIEPRQVQVYDLEIFKDTLSTDHSYEFIKSVEVEGELIEEKLSKNPTLNDNKLYFSKEYTDSKGLPEGEPIDVGNSEPPVEAEKSTEFKAPLLHFKTKVSSGTYIRSLISDIGKSLRSSAYMVKLIRCQQAEWELGKNVFEIDDFEKRDERVWGTVLKSIFAKGGENVNDIKELFETAEKEVAVLKEEETSVTAEPTSTEDKETLSISQDAEEPNEKKRKLEEEDETPSAPVSI